MQSAPDLSSTWLARIAVADSEALIALRLLAGVEICVQDTWAWVRGPCLGQQQFEGIARAIPGIIHCSGQLGGPATVNGRQLPSGLVPEIGWSPLRDRFTLHAARPALPGQVGQRAAVRLVRSQSEQPCTLLRCAWAAVAEWAETVPEHRLTCLRFAVATVAGKNIGREVLLRGQLLRDQLLRDQQLRDQQLRDQPLPLLHGVRHWLLGPLALPAGWTIAPPLAADDALTLTGLGRDDVVLVDGPDTVRLSDHQTGWHVIAADSWMHATRSAIRATGAAHD